MTPISATTRVAAVIGDPVRHSLSPAIHNAAFAAAGLDWIFVAFEVPAGDAGAAVAAMRALGLGGMSVTMPHKAAVADAVDRLSPAAATLGVVNCVHWDGDQLVGDNTDGDGLVRSLADEGITVPGRRCAVLGAGGAARSVVAALAAHGAAEVAVRNRTGARARAAADLAGETGTVLDDGADLSGFDLVVNATSVGMAGGPPGMPADPAWARPGQVCVDLVYHPRRTAWLDAVSGQGATAVDGVGMLVGQAALAFERWTGVDAPLAAMRAVVSDI